MTGQAINKYVIEKSDGGETTYYRHKSTSGGSWVTNLEEAKLFDKKGEASNAITQGGAMFEKNKDTSDAKLSVIPLYGWVVFGDPVSTYSVEFGEEWHNRRGRFLKDAA